MTSAVRIIPCLDIAGGRVVKGVQFQGLRDMGDPVELALRYAAQGADELMLLDIKASDPAQASAAAILRALRPLVDRPITVGGGVRDVASAGALRAAGADRVAVNSAAVADPALIDRLAAAFGAEAVVLSVDACASEDRAACPSGFALRTRGGAALLAQDAVAWAQEGVRRGAGQILLTSWDRDGTGEGYDLDLLRAVSAAVAVPVIASGGASALAHFAEARAAGAGAVLAASLFHEGRFTVAQVRAALGD